MNPILLHLSGAIVAFCAAVPIGWYLRSIVLEQVEGESPVQRPRWLRRGTFIGAGIVLLAVVATIGVVVAVSEYGDSTNCQVEYNRAVAVSNKERAAAADQDRIAQKKLAQATVAMVDSLLAPQPDPAQVHDSISDYRRAYQTYLEDVTRSEAIRRLNPLPPIPDCAVE